MRVRIRTKTLETQQIEREYNFLATTAIIHHSEYGLLLINQGFGGMDSLEGGAVRWKHGTAISLKKGDTFEALENGEWNELTNHLNAILYSWDDERPMLDLSGQELAKIAESSGLSQQIQPKKRK